MKTILLFLFIVFNLSAVGQNQNSIWCFGDSAGIDFTNISSPTPIITGIDSRGSCASIADANGILLFDAFTRAGYGNYSTQVFNSNNSLMQNGDTIVGEGWYNELLIIPAPGNTNLYFLFSIGEAFVPSQGFYYSIVDMSLNGGLGKVTQKNVKINNFRNADCVTAIKHGNGRDWWVFSKYSSTNGSSYNRFYEYLITPDSINSPIVQDFNNATDGDVQRIVFNNDGSRFMQINAAGFMCEYNFDRCTGTISNPHLIFPEIPGNGLGRQFWSGAYSKDDTKFYISTNVYSLSISDTSRLLQYDLTAADIPASCDSLFYITYPVMGGTVRLAPDNKIYYTCIYGAAIPNGYPYPDSVRNVYNENLGVINFPDSVGSACDFKPFSFYLNGKRTYWGLPNNPNYELGSLAGSACDTLTSVPELTAEYLPLSIYPNPFYNKITLLPFNSSAKQIVINIFNDVGEVVYAKNSTLQLQEIDLSGLSGGIYLMQVEMKEKRFMKRIVKL